MMPAPPSSARAPSDEARGALSVVVLSCGNLGAEVARRLRGMPSVRSVTLITAPYRQPRRGTAGKVRHVYRMQGLPGLLRVIGSKLLASLRRGARPDANIHDAPLEGEIRHHHFGDFHDAACLETIRAIAPDLGVVAGTYILREKLFGIPRLGSINLHSGKVPQYRGAAPAFWELYNGETEVGITIHRVVAALDAGDILLEEAFPLERAPAGDPLAYLERYRSDVLRTNGVRMLAEAVAGLASGALRGRPQERATAPAQRTPDYRAVRELRRRVRERRLRRR